MRRLCQGRTIFLIAQRFSTVQHADLILVLQEGRVTAQGRHEELVLRDDFYREFVRQQAQRQ
jgi:ABC-type multidrug transport system fused ATPase/permease subunit